jgi:hypothetical protein
MGISIRNSSFRLEKNLEEVSLPAKMARGRHWATFVDYGDEGED